jgi:hypothetical protein
MAEIMEKSILKTIRKMVGGDDSNTAFDTDLMIFINSAFFNLFQCGVGETAPVRITDVADEWDQKFPSEKCIDEIKTFVYSKTKLSFDPPSTSFGIEALEKLANEAECRILMQKEQEAIETEGGEIT